MRFIIIASFIFLIGYSFSGYSQYLFSEKFESCNTDRFKLESDSVIARIDYELLLNSVRNSLGERVTKKIQGIISFQFIVDVGGGSCLISLRNDTKTRIDLNTLKANLDNNLKWQNNDERVAAVVVLRFKDGGIGLKRLGLNANRGVHELVE